MKLLKSTQHQLVITIFTLILLSVGIVHANENDLFINADLIQIDIDQLDGYPIPPTIGGYTILPGGIVEGVPQDLAPAPGACDQAAGSYVSEGIQVIRTTMISFDSIVFDNKDPEVVLYALYTIEAMEFFGLDVLFDSPQNMDSVMPFTDGTVVTIGANSTCITSGPLTARLWQLDNGLWAIDTITFNETFDISDMWDNTQQNNPQLGNIQLDMPVLVEGVVIRYMLPYIEPPITTVPANNDQLAPNDAQLFSCDGTAPSYLSIGMDVFLDGYGYEKFPTNIEEYWTDWLFNDTSVQLSDYGMGVYLDVLQETPLVGIPGNLESVILPPQELYQGINFGEVVDGPVCTSVNAEPPSSADGGVIEAANPDEDRFYTWWQIEVNGQVGWYPEVVGQYSHWLWNDEGMFNRKLIMYYMVPANLMQTQSNDCQPSNLFAGLQVEPAQASVNIRTQPNGDILGRLEMGQPATLFGEPTCNGGINWWQTDRGYIAESDPETRNPLLMPYVPEPEPTVEPTIESAPQQNVQPQPSQQTTPEPTDDGDKDKDKDKDKDDSGSSCDPATGRGC